MFFRYLQEIGYTDTIIDVRSNRVRSLLGLNNNTDTEEMNTPALNGNEGVAQDKQEYNESLVRRGKQQHPPKKVEITKYIFRNLNFNQLHECWLQH